MLVRQQSFIRRVVLWLILGGVEVSLGEGNDGGLEGAVVLLLLKLEVLGLLVGPEGLPDEVLLGLLVELSALVSALSEGGPAALAPAHLGHARGLDVRLERAFLHSFAVDYLLCILPPHLLVSCACQPVVGRQVAFLN